jgi:cell division septum initiation protein DivIVA
VRDLAIAIDALQREDQELDAEIEELERQLAATSDPAAHSTAPVITAPSRPEDDAGSAS